MWCDMIEIGEYSKAYNCPVCSAAMRLVEKDGDYQYKYECDAMDHNSGMGVQIERAEMDETIKCPTCKGRMEVACPIPGHCYMETCHDCKGTGRVPKPQEGR